MHYLDIPLSEPPVPIRPQPGRPMVAVLPFAGEGEDPSLRRMGEAIADLLHEGLQRHPAMQPILVRSEFLAKAPPHALELVCRELRVGHLISGKCHGTGDEPSVYVELSDTRQWHICWAHFYRGGARGLLDPQGETMPTLVDILGRALGPRP